MHRKYQFANLYFFELIVGALLFVATLVNAIMYLGVNPRYIQPALVAIIIIFGVLGSLLLIIFGLRDMKRNGNNPIIKIESDLFFKEKTDTFHNTFIMLNKMLFVILISLGFISVSIIQLVFGFGRNFTVAYYSNYIGFPLITFTIICSRILNLLLEYWWEKDYLWILQYEEIKKKN